MQLEPINNCLFQALIAVFVSSISCNLSVKHYNWDQLRPCRPIFFQNDDIFIQLDELDRITQTWIGFNNSLTQEQKTI